MSDLSTKIKKVDRGQEFGRFGTHGTTFFYQHTEQQLASTIERIAQENKFGLRIADLGGANGIVARYLLERLGRKISFLDVFDIDTNKFPSRVDGKIRYKEADLRRPIRGDYDLVILRSVLHYLPLQDQIAVLRTTRTCLDDTDSFAVIIQPIPIPEQKDRIQKAYDWLSTLKDSNKKYWTQQEDIERLCQEVGLEVVESELGPQLHATVDTFYKDRYQLTKEEGLEFYRKYGTDPFSFETLILHAKNCR